jgi:hypothetical protein
MAGSVTITYSETRPGIKSVTWAWTSDASGDVSGTDTKALTGEAVRFVTNPGATAPTDNYDIVVNDADGADIAAGCLANRDTANTEQAVPIVETTVGANTYGTSAAAFDGPLSLVVSNAGNAKQGALTMYYR